MKGGICLERQFSVREGWVQSPYEMFEDMGTRVLAQLMVLKNNIISHVLIKFESTKFKASYKFPLKGASNTGSKIMFCKVLAIKNRKIRSSFYGS
jgi:hypothetical protein